eukprot:6188106-Pleurochrysis_carterae.AAC.5
MRWSAKASTHLGGCSGPICVRVAQTQHMSSSGGRCIERAAARTAARTRVARMPPRLAQPKALRSHAGCIAAARVRTEAPIAAAAAAVRTVGVGIVRGLPLWARTEARAASSALRKDSATLRGRGVACLSSVRARGCAVAAASRACAWLGARSRARMRAMRRAMAASRTASTAATRARARAKAEAAPASSLRASAVPRTALKCVLRADALAKAATSAAEAAVNRVDAAPVAIRPPNSVASAKSSTSV